MELKHLRNFVVIANEGNISGAARRLHMAQPPLSTQMHQLEKELGCTLFERGARSITLTEEGRLLYSRAKAILNITDLIGEEIHDIKKSAYRLRIGVISSASMFLPQRLLPDFHRQFPDTFFDLHEGNTYQLMELLRSGVIELAIVRTPFDREQFHCLNLEEECMYAVGKAAFFELPSPADAIRLEALAQKPLILYRRWEQVVENLFYQIGAVPNYLCKNDDARTTLYWAECGYGIGIVPASILPRAEGKDLLRLRILEKQLSTNITVICPKNVRLSPIAESFLEYCRRQNTGGSV